MSDTEAKNTTLMDVTFIGLSVNQVAALLKLSKDFGFQRLVTPSKAVEVTDQRL